jgi:Tol biopolymer transport system component
VSPDGAHVAFRRADLTYDGSLSREVWVIRSDGTDPIKVAADQGSRGGTPTWSPDGKRIAFVRTALAYDARERSIEVNEWKKGSAETLFSDGGLTTALHWLPDGRLSLPSSHRKPRDRETPACGYFRLRKREIFSGPRNASRKDQVRSRN